MPRPLPSRGDIARCLAQAGRGLHAREIASRCDVPEASYRHLLELLDQLAIDGTVQRLPGTRFKAKPLEQGSAASWEGRLTCNPRGFGFVTAAGHEDVYVAPDGIGAALHGDQVTVTVIARSARGLEGRIEAIVTRRSPRVAGVLRHRGRSRWLEPDDTRLRGPIVLLPSGDDSDDGRAAVVSIVRYPTRADENPEGDLIAILGRPGDPQAEVAKILVREEIPDAHTPAALAEAETLAQNPPPVPNESRVDLRHVPLPTIDPEDARDHDDAVWVEKHGDAYRVWVAIADVSEYVQPGTALDQEALERGASVYLPDRAIPMLPPALTTDVCSLLPDHDRLCLCLVAELDEDGRVQGYDVIEGVMRSVAKLTYGGVARALGFTVEGSRSPAAEDLRHDLRIMDELARKLRRRRMRRGALDLDLPEAQVLLDDRSGAPVDIKRRAGDPGVRRAYQLVEELMLLANECVASWLSERRCPTVYRVHGRPDEAKLERLAQVAGILGARLDVSQLSDPAGFGRWLASIQEHPRRDVLEMLLLRSLKQATYDITNIGHFGLASDAYLHFTSPIRRYPDIEVHRSLKRLLRGGSPDTTPEAIEALRLSATTASTRERAIVDVEREVVDLYRALYMRDQVGEIFEGTVAAIVGGGLFVTLDEPFVDVLVRWESMGPDHYEASEDELSAVGRRSGDTVKLGDRMQITVEDVAVLRRTVYGERIVPDRLRDSLWGGRKGRGNQARQGPPPPRIAGRAGRALPAHGRSAARGGRGRSTKGRGRRK